MFECTSKLSRVNQIFSVSFAWHRQQQKETNLLTHGARHFTPFKWCNLNNEQAFPFRKSQSSVHCDSDIQSCFSVCWCTFIVILLPLPLLASTERHRRRIARRIDTARYRRPTGWTTQTNANLSRRSPKVDRLRENEPPVQRRFVHS